MPFGYALRNGSGWATDRFTFGATDHGKCDGCGCTARLSHDSGDSEKLCQTCIDDRELGKRLHYPVKAYIIDEESQQGLVSLLGERWDISPDGPLTIPAVCYAPVENGELATFEQIASRAPGRPYLAYLRIDADRIGQQFRALAGDPQRTWGLSGLLDGAFSTAVPNLIRASYPSIYPVYTGGDDLFVIGPWNEIFDFAAAWRSKFREISGDRLTLLGRKGANQARQHILTKSDEAADALDEHAKIPRDSIHALGATIPWAKFDEVLKCARQLAEFHAAGQIRGALLHDIIELHGRWRKGDARWHSLLFYQVERNMGGDAKTFVRRALLSPGDLWKHADFVVRYAMLRSGEREKN